MIVILLLADIKATENPRKIREALLNICPVAEIKSVQDPSGTTFLQGSATGPEALATLARKFREGRILEAVRRVFLKQINEDVLIFGIHRQAAYMDRLHICNLDDVSATGPIRVEIRAKNLLDIIDFVAPPTLKGKPQHRGNLQLE
jgi:predicted RNA binding protein with dsRBD fold (UPF0201 family)